ncbi:hypothetical protein SAMN05192533_102221 [Mesobacillus persicus]|uniref:PilX N-terminal n=1 Tax=Mesobacillus persicus TaxID=930146 RepID=A0A1H7XI48_9BACI|nr:hypothetical protein [Mesobacillus persicus]SEM33450.1 hypothetical protein SAMN05192533_102221 [Mesobacillus persicus]
MSKVSNEKGYALVTVLLIIVVFMIVFVSFTGLAFNSVKQNDVIETTAQSIDLAEMGVSYYHVAIQGAFEEAKQEIDNNIENYATVEEVKAALVTSLQSKINILFSAPIEVKEGEEAEFVIKTTEGKQLVDGTKDKIIEINYSVEGQKNGETPKKLDAEVVLNLQDLVFQPGDPETTDEPPFVYTVNKPEVPMDCNFNYLLDEGDSIQCEGVVINTPPNSVSYPKNNTINVSTIYAPDVHFTFDGNINKASQLTIYAESLTLGMNFNSGSDFIIKTDQNLTMESNMNNLTNSELYIGQDLIMKSNMKNLDNSNLRIAGHLKAESNVELQNTSKIFIYSRSEGFLPAGSSEKSSIVDQGLTIQEDSVMCVDGNIFLGGTPHILGKLIVSGNVNRTGTNIIQLDSEEERVLYNSEDYCDGFFNFSNLNWGNANTAITDVTYN